MISIWKQKNQSRKERGRWRNLHVHTVLDDLDAETAKLNKERREEAREEKRQTKESRQKHEEERKEANKTRDVFLKTGAKQSMGWQPKGKREQIQQDNVVARAVQQSDYYAKGKAKQRSAPYATGTKAGSRKGQPQGNASPQQQNHE